jgi:hypothetical protein
MVDGDQAEGAMKICSSSAWFMFIEQSKRELLAGGSHWQPPALFAASDGYDR